jgi:hypothetical protein
MIAMGVNSHLIRCNLDSEPIDSEKPSTRRTLLVASASQAMVCQTSQRAASSFGCSASSPSFAVRCIPRPRRSARMQRCRAVQELDTNATVQIQADPITAENFAPFGQVPYRIQAIWLQQRPECVAWVALTAARTLLLSLLHGPVMAITAVILCPGPALMACATAP